MFFLLMTALFGQQGPQVLFLEEEINVELPGDIRETYRRNIYIGKDSIRTDFQEEKLRLIYGLSLKTLFVIDLENERYFYARPGRERSLSRQPLQNLATLAEDQLVRPGPLIVETGRRKSIAGWPCSEYAVQYKDRVGLQTSIWVTRNYLYTDKRLLKNLFHAALGTNPPLDVRQLISHLVERMNGLPIRMETTFRDPENDEFVIKTTSTYTAINRQHNVDRSFFGIPQNYELVREEDFDRPWQQN